MTEERQHTLQQGHDINMRDLVLRVREWCRYLRSRWLIILIVGLIGGTLGFIYAWRDKPDYEGELTFVLEETKASPLGAYAGLASQFGVDISGGSGVFTGDNILEFLRSRLMIEETLLSGLIIPGRPETSLVEMYIDMYRMRDGWAEVPGLRDLHFPLQAARLTYSREQDSILDVIYQRIIKVNLEVSKPDKKLSFISVKCISPDEIFSKFFTERLVKKATEFYIETKTKRSRTNVNILEAKADSLEKLLNKKTYSVAATEDINQNPAKRVATVGMQVGIRDKLVIQTIYGEVMKNLEMSRMAMAQEMPLIQVIDKPILPLHKKKVGKIKGTAVGGFLAGVLICALLIILETYRRLIT